MSDLFPARGHVPVLGHLRPKLISLELDPDQLAIDALVTKLFQRSLTDVVLRLLFDQVLEAHHVERGVAEADVRAPVEDASLDPSGLARCDRPDVELLTRRRDRVPQLVAPVEVEQIHFEAPVSPSSRCG